MKHLLLYLLLMSLHLPMPAREYSFEQITSIDGLSQNNVLSICKDHDGYLWFGTYDGLNRYDGLDFKIYKNDGTDHSLSDNLIRCLIEDHNHKLWIGTFSMGLSVFDRHTEKFAHIRNTPENPNRITRNTIMDLLCDSKGNIWASTHAGLNLLQPQPDGTYKIIQIVHDPQNPSSLSDNVVQSVMEDSKGRIWACTYSCVDLMKMGPHGEITNDFYHITKREDYWDIRNAIEINEGYVFSFYTGIAMIELNEAAPEKSTIINYPGPPLYYMQKDLEGNLWTGGHNGILKFDYHPGEYPLYKLVDIEARGSQDFSINSVYIRTILYDDNGIMWFGTNGEGVLKLNTQRTKFRHYKNTDAPGSISHNKVFNIYEDPDQNIWFGTEGGGVNLLTRENAKNYKTGFTQFDICIPGEQNIVFDLINASDRDPRLIWAGVGYNSKLIQITPDKAHWKVEPILPELTHQIMALCKDEYGTIWLGSYEGGLSKYLPHRDGGKLITYTPENSTLPARIIRYFYEDSKGRLWITTDLGLLLMTREQKRSDTLSYTLFRHDANDTTSISANYTVPVIETHNGEIWIGTFGNGINLYHEGTTLTNGYFTSIGTKNGLPNDMIKNIIEDNDGELWITSNKGLSRLDKSRTKIRNYTPFDGLQDLDFMDLSGTKLHDGEILIGGVHGFNAFYPDEIVRDSVPPIVVFNELDVSDKRVKINEALDGNTILTKTLNVTDHIVLKHTQNNFQIYFSAIHFVGAKGNTYKYMLEGFDKNWILTGSDYRIARYTNLDVGRYVFKVMAANSDGIWTQQPKTLSIWIKPPFWLTLWFKITVILLSLLIVSSIILFRFYLIKQRNLALEKEVEKRTDEIQRKNTILYNQARELKKQKDDLEISNATKDKFYSIIAHDLKGPFSTMQGYLELLQKKVNDYSPDQRTSKIEHALEASQSLFRLVQNLLQWSRIQRGLIPFHPIESNIFLEVQQLMPVYKNMAAQKGILLTYNFIDPELTAYFDPDMFNAILRNLLSNAIKYTRPSDEIRISVSQTMVDGKKESLFCIADTGTGIPESAIEHLFQIDSKYSTEGTNHEQGTGLGLILCKEFVEYHQGKIWIESEVGVGTKVSFTLCAEP